ncbi:MAG TPA: hypothetical protein VMF59_02985 [Bacteroidota bacterium]|nr:hypothetical protein [Bacteroidota bacterium]
MLKSIVAALVVLSFAAVGSAIAQVQEEDVVVLKDSTIIRGTITQTVTPGSSVTVRRSSGKVTSLLWSEILVIKRLPVNMPDSSIAALFMGSASGGARTSAGVSSVSGGFSSPFGMASRDTTEEDIFILADGRIVRGTMVESSQKGSVGLWTADQKLSVYRDAEIQKKLHMAKGTTDSTIDVMYIHPLPEMIADNFRILTVFGGFSTAAGGFATPSEDGADPGGSGYALGVHASVRLFPMIRWATSVIYGRNKRDIPLVLTNYTASASPDPYQLIWLLTGAEVRTEGTSSMKSFGFVQGGMLFSKISGFDVVIPQTVNHPAGVGSQGGASSKSFAFCLGVGVSFGRFSLSGRWITSSASYAYTTGMDFGGYYGGAVWKDFKFDQPVNVVLICAGFSPL